MDYPKMDQLLKIPFRMSAIERNELIIIPYGHGFTSLTVHEVISHHNNNRKLTLDLNTVEECCLKWVLRFK